MSRTQTHWERIYRTKQAGELSWFQAVPEVSLAMMRELALSPSVAVLDVGGGTSTLVDCLLAEGYTDVTVLDISPAALRTARERLGDTASQACWIEADITTFRPPRRFRLWHDRAVFHFLTGPNARKKYRQVVQNSVEQGGYVLLATFAEDGPQKCSGLDVVRYSVAELTQEMGEAFQLLTSTRENHVTPGGITQAFNYCLFRFEPTA